MRRALLIAKRDYLAAVRTRAFLIGLIVAPLLFGGGFLGIALMRAKPDLNTRRIAVVDHSSGAAVHIFQAAKEKSERGAVDSATGRQVAPRYELENVAAGPEGADALRLALSDRVRSRELDAFVEIGQGVLRPDAPAAEQRVTYSTNAGGIDQLRNWLAGPVSDGIRVARLAELGIDPALRQGLVAGVSLERMSLVERDEKTGRIGEARRSGEAEGFLIPYALVLLMAMMVMMGSSPMLTAVTMDKTQRVAEMLLGAATPMELMAGKVLAAVAVSLTSSAFYVAGGFFVLQGLGMVGMLQPAIFVWFYVYLLAEMIMLCSLAAALGAMASTPEDAQHLALLVIAPVVLPLFVVVAVMSQPNSLLSTGLSLFPLFTPLLMLVRQALPGGPPAWQPWVGLAGVLMTVSLIVWVAARIFRIGIMFHGKLPKGSEVLRWAIRG